MNKRIKALVKQAGGLVYDDDNNELTPMIVGKVLEKFAELVVQECAKQCEDIGSRWHAIDTTHASGAKAGAWECAVELRKLVRATK